MGLMSPRRINDSPLMIRRLLSTADEADQTFGRVQSNKRYGSPERFLGQLYSLMENRRLIGPVGNIGKAMGSVLYRTPCDPACHLKPGDLIVGLPKKQNARAETDFRAVNFAVMEDPTPCGHLPGPSLWRVFYTENLDKVSGKKAHT